MCAITLLQKVFYKPPQFGVSNLISTGKFKEGMGQEEYNRKSNFWYVFVLTEK